MDFLDKWRVNRDTREGTGIERATDGRQTGAKEPVSSADLKVSRTPSNEDRRIYAANYRNKNKAAINAQRRAQEQEPMGAYKKARRRARYKKQPWDISFDNWFHVWNSCPKIYDDMEGMYRHAWSMRSGDIQKGTQMRRLDTNKGWQVGNVEIVYRNQSIPAHGVVALWDYREDKPEEINGDLARVLSVGGINFN